MAEQEAILADYLAAIGDDLEPPGECEAFLHDPDIESPAEQDGPTTSDDELITHDGTGPGGPGFESGSVLDLMPPGPVLIRALDDVERQGLDQLSDNELAGVILAFRRLESRGAAGMLAGVAELDRRRQATGDWRVTKHIDGEMAILLTMTRRSASTLLEFAASLSRLPATAAALAAGRIDRVKANLIAYETGLLDADLAAAIELLVIEDAPTLTTAGLRARLRRAVLAADPEAARRRVEQARQDARVELSDERSGGTAALAGRDLPVAGALAADQRINAAAKALKAGGAKATLPQLRAAVFLSLLTGADALEFLPAAAQPAPDAEPAAQPAQDAEPADGQVPASKPTLRGSVHLTMPLATWLGAARSPGEIAGFGPASAETCQELADWIAQNPGSRWCVSVTDKAGHAVGHGCARRPPPPATDTARLAAWLARLKIRPIEAGTCTHAREVPGYRIPESLHHIVKIRQKTCSNPVCAWPAQLCDDDHTLPHGKGGRTCECDLGPVCRTCHQAKQAPGWRLEQPSPGVLIWQPPHGRRYTVKPGVYPT
ncbi:MAG TPA: DUF222 domain-containing protein [Streptosporangiaceae bacterium]